MPPFGPIVLLPAPHVVSGSFHHQIDDRGQRLIQAVVRDHRYVVAERLALDVFLHSSDVGETLDVSLERPGGCVCGSDREVAAMQVFFVDDTTTPEIYTLSLHLAHPSVWDTIVQ